MSAVSRSSSYIVHVLSLSFEVVGSSVSSSRSSECFQEVGNKEGMVKTLAKPMLHYRLLNCRASGLLEQRIEPKSIKQLSQKLAFQRGDIFLRLLSAVSRSSSYIVLVLFCVLVLLMCFLQTDSWQSLHHVVSFVPTMWFDSSISSQFFECFLPRL